MGERRRTWKQPAWRITSFQGTEPLPEALSIVLVHTGLSGNGLDYLMGEFNGGCAVDGRREHPHMAVMRGPEFFDPAVRHNSVGV